MYDAERIRMTISEAKEHTLKNKNIIGFSLESDKIPNGSKKKYFTHFKEGGGNIIDIGKWHTYIVTNIITNSESDSISITNYKSY